MLATKGVVMESKAGNHGLKRCQFYGSLQEPRKPKSLTPLLLYKIGTRTPMSSYAAVAASTANATASKKVEPCMIMEDDELEQAQKIRETFRKNPSYGGSWRGATEEFMENTRIFGSSKLGTADAFPRAFQSYATKVRSANEKGAASFTATAEPPGTLIASVRKTFYNSEKASAQQQRPQSPKTPTYSDDTK